MRNEALGVDIGGVIIDRINDGTDTSFFSENYLNTSAVADVFEVLEALVRRRFANRVFLVSKCGLDIQNKTMHWLDHHRFFDRTGIKRDHVRFCRKRSDKADICKKLDITHFIDDRLEVLSYLTTVGDRFLFRPNQAEMQKYSSFLIDRIYVVQHWQEIADQLLPKETP